MLDIQRNRRARKYPSGEMIRRILWNVAQPLFRLNPRPCFGWRRFLLRLFRSKDWSRRSRLSFGDDLFPLEPMKDVNPWSIVVGNPARESKRREITQ